MGKKTGFVGRSKDLGDNPVDSWAQPGSAGLGISPLQSISSGGGFASSGSVHNLGPKTGENECVFDNETGVRRENYRSG